MGCSGALRSSPGLARPLGALLVVPAAIECCEGVEHTHPARSTMSPRSKRSSRTAALVTVIAGPLGCGAFLAFVRMALRRRLRAASDPGGVRPPGGARRSASDPRLTTRRCSSTGSHLGTALHLPWVILAVVLLVVVAVKLPASYAAFAFCILAVALTASNLDSFERYALSAFPLVMAAASLYRSASRPRPRCSCSQRRVSSVTRCWRSPVSTCRRPQVPSAGGGNR